MVMVFHDQSFGGKTVFFFGPMPPHVLVGFVVLPPGHGRSVTDLVGMPLGRGYVVPMM